MAIEQRVEEGAVVMAGLKPEEMTQIMRRFDQYVRNQKQLEKIVNTVLAECKTVRRDLFEWTDTMNAKEEKRLKEEEERVHQALCHAPSPTSLQLLISSA